MNGFKTHFFIIGLALACASGALAQQQQSARTDAEQMRSRLATTVRDALLANRFDEMALNLSKYNRDRIAEAPFDGFDRLHASLDRMKKSYRAAYGRDFVFSSDLLGEVSVSRQHDADHFMVRVSLAGLPHAEMWLVRDAFQGNPWRIDLFNPTANRLGDALARHFDQLAGSRWPKDADAGRRMIAQHVLLALVEQPNANFQATDK